ncbi:CIC11C00000003212 [Sungouiella intermedia]|uniref:CIC11C00000003212 n=1 Tax=Sungouiella intermedia TaxID=45354 RepID=A0A1L0GRT9_9ASCO|nr:CIC11C00000003212 [[Candida] intermedia]
MSDKVSTDQYGRKTWDVEAYAEEARRGKSKKDAPSDKAVELVKNLNGQNYLDHRAYLLDESVLAVGKHTLISADSNTSSTFGKNKRFGFFCPVCDLSFRDTLALVDHFNSAQHQLGTPDLGEDVGEVKRASAEEVAKTIENLVQQLLRAQAVKGADSLQVRIVKRQEFEAKKLAARKERRKRQKTKKNVRENAEDEVNSEMAAMMDSMGLEALSLGMD